MASPLAPASGIPCLIDRVKRQMMPSLAVTDWKLLVKKNIGAAWKRNGGAIVHQGLLRFLVDGQKNLRRAYGGCDIERAALESRSEMRKSDSNPIRIHHSRFMRIAPLLLRESSSSLSPWVLSVKTNFLLLPRRRGNCSLCVLQSPRTRSDVRQGRGFRFEFSSNVIVIGELR